MSRNSSYNSEPCFNPQCLNNGAPADWKNAECWIGSEDDPNVFCSVQCKAHYQQNMVLIESDQKIFNRVKKNKSAYIKHLVEAIHAYSGKTFDKKIIKKVVESLDLSSAWVK